MKHDPLPLDEVSISELFFGNDKVKYEIPIYQRNYAWGNDEITALVNDVKDASEQGKDVYYIGTLVTYTKDDEAFEVIDGQQRLTTIMLILKALGVDFCSRLSFRARAKANRTLLSLQSDVSSDEERDKGIERGYGFAKTAVEDLKNSEKFKKYFLYNVRLIHYRVPRDINLNHYFEIMNSRGEQLEKHEVVKAKLLGLLKPNDTASRSAFAAVWESCSDMNTYIQQKLNNESLFGRELCCFIPEDFDGIVKAFNGGTKQGRVSINDILSRDAEGNEALKKKKEDRPDTFQAIIDFPNFLLIVLKLTLKKTDADLEKERFNLDDKELIKGFSELKNEKDVKLFGFNLLKAKFFLDNYMIHHSNDEDSIDNNPWILRHWNKDDRKGVNLSQDNDTQNQLVQLLSMFEVSFTPRQRKNYLFYCLLHLFDDYEGGFKGEPEQLKDYCAFADALAKKYINDIYLVRDNLNEINTPLPGKFDDVIISEGRVDTSITEDHSGEFYAVFGDGTSPSKGIPLFVFNYLDYKLWLFYAQTLRGKKSQKRDAEREKFFNKLGCSDFELDVFDQFYFSRTRRSLEHYFPRTTASEELNDAQKNCFGNYAMIGSDANSAGSNKSPAAKLNEYLDRDSGKIRRVSVASIKFMIMMQICKDNRDRENGKEWIFEDIKAHQEKMLDIMFG